MIKIMSNPEDVDAAGGSSPKPSSSLFVSVSSYNRLHSKDPNQIMSNNNPKDEDEDEDGENSPSLKPKHSSLFFSLSSYNRFRIFSRRRLQSLQTSSSSASSDDDNSIPYSMHEIFYDIRDSSECPSSPPPPSSQCKYTRLKIPCSSFKRCTLRNEKVVIFCRHIRFQEPGLSPSHLSTLTSRSHHPTLVSLLGASRSEDNGHIYMVYEDTPGATLRECLQNLRSNPLSNWIWRMQIALDLAQGLDYIHNRCRMVHKMIKSTTVIVTEPNSNACIWLFGANRFLKKKHEKTLGYIPEPDRSWYPEVITHKSDVYAFGIVILELISGKRVWEKLEDETVHIAKTARDIYTSYEPEDKEIRRGRVMQFVDSRLHDSFPVETAESLIWVALQCVEFEPSARPEMTSVAGEIQRLFLASKVWQKETMKYPPTSFSLSSLLHCENNEDVSPKKKLVHYPSLLY